MELIGEGRLSMVVSIHHLIIVDEAGHGGPGHAEFQRLALPIARLSAIIMWWRLPSLKESASVPASL
jgi:hypothetical protein